MEAAEPDSYQKAQSLHRQYAAHFAEFTLPCTRAG